MYIGTTIAVYSGSTITYTEKKNVSNIDENTDSIDKILVTVYCLIVIFNIYCSTR